MNHPNFGIKRMLMLIAIIITSVNAWAETHDIVVQNNNFTPANISIEAGDTIRWENFGSLNHNVSSTNLNYIFRCANGCDDVGGDGTAAGIGWVSEVTFHNPVSSIPYICEPHVSFGMTGSINVQEPDEFETITVSEGSGFVPKSLTIPQYSAVLVTNNGGEHNIYADDDSFRCADGCRDDGIQGDDDYNGFPWQIFLKFNEPGIFTFHCENPAHNESGLIEVISEIIFANGFESI